MAICQLRPTHRSHRLSPLIGTEGLELHAREYGELTWCRSRCDHERYEMDEKWMLLKKGENHRYGAASMSAGSGDDATRTSQAPAGCGNS